MMHTLAWELERFPHGLDADPAYIDAVVTYRYTPGCPARINCDPDDGWDAQPAEVEIDDVVDKATGRAIAITDEERKAIEEHVLGRPPYLGPDPDDARDRLIEDREFFRDFADAEDF